ncbi:MAG: hypothetical protein KW806_00445 [Candidatus Yanofskybacteria bacterium]|nr:hypothetical protein [Candidatus Yanofskybacteria bacterium]
MPKKQFVNLNNARLKEQISVMKEIETIGVCPFCPEHLKKFHKKPILKKTRYWLLTKNQWPYENTRIHLLAITRKHTETLSELPKGAGEELISLARWAEKKFKIKSGGFGMRFGDPSMNGGTVRHLHAQIMTPLITNQKSKQYKPVRLRIG